MDISQTGNSSTLLERSLGMPEGGPRCIPLPLDFGAVPQYTLDYTNMQQRGFFSMVQSVYVDNSNSTTILAITVQGSQQILKVPPGAQGYFPLLVPNPIRLQFDSAGGVVVTVILLNFPVAGILWELCPCLDLTATNELLQAILDALAGGGPS
jgi:hypothetical protein